MGDRKHNKHLFGVLFVLAIYMIGVAGYVLWSHQDVKKSILSNIDKRLLIGAQGLKYMLPEDYHDKVIDENSISTEENKRLALKLSRFREKSGFGCAYTIVKNEGMVYFAASTISEETLKIRDSWYFEPYHEAVESVKSAFDETEPVFAIVTDRWGTFRSVLVPETSPGGRKYLAVTDYEISYVKSLLRRNLVKSIFTAFIFILLSVPMILLYRRFRLDHITELERLNKQLKDDLAKRKEIEVELRDREQELCAANEQMAAGQEQLNASMEQLIEHEEELEVLARFPDECPNPMLRISGSGNILYSNKASGGLLGLWQECTDDLLSGRWHQYVKDALACSQSQQAEVECDGRTYSLTFAPVTESDYVNIYALDITYRKHAEQNR